MVKVSEVKSQIDRHEAICSERWLETLHRVKRLENIILGSASASLLMLLGLLLR